MYFQTKSDLRALERFRRDLLEFWDLEYRMKDGEVGQDIEAEYFSTREGIAKAVPQVSAIADRHGSAHYMHGPLDIFRTILAPPPRRQFVQDQTILDHIDEAIGACERDLRSEFWALVNPLHWIKVLLVTIIRLPFILVSLSGFDVEKVEEHLFGRLFKLAEVAGIVYLLVRLGLDTEAIGDAVVRLLGQ